MKAMTQRDAAVAPVASLAKLAGLEAALGEAIQGKPEVLRLALACLLARGHLLIEDVPGVGKTTLAQALARAARARFHRIQFTADMLPADVVGVTIYNARTQEFEFKPGPIFTNFLLADEINRATPKTQSALLEAMAERQVTVDGETHRLPDPFIVIATQNPVDLAGTFPLPDSQLDRFLARLALGYPDPASERAMLAEPDRRLLIDRLTPRLDRTGLRALRAATAAQLTGAALIDYVQRLLAASRSTSGIAVGLSPRAGLALLAAARALSLIDGRDHVLPEDVQAVFVAVAAHRLVPAADEPRSREALAETLLARVAVDA